MPTVEEVTAAYIRKRDLKAEIAKRHAEELAPINAAMEKMEQWFLAKMAQDGVDSFKTGAGTPYKATATSVTCADALAFKDFIFEPAVAGVLQYLQSVGYPAGAHDALAIKNVLMGSEGLKLSDIRVNKKGVQEFMETHKVTLPGVNVTQIATVNVRRA